MADYEIKGKDVAGCMLSVWGICVTTPMWLILLFAVLNAADVPMWTWALYWAYVPASLLGVVMASVLKAYGETEPRN